MSETLLSILTSEVWSWDSREAIYIIFDKEGTGKVIPLSYSGPLKVIVTKERLQLLCCAEHVVWISAEFDWKPLSPDVLDHAVTISSDSRKKPHTIAQIDIEMTLTKRRVSNLCGLEGIDTHKAAINESRLTENAFQPKSYTVHLEEGVFLRPGDAMREVNFSDSSKFALRLVFDPSPYPPQHEWREQGGSTAAMKFWEWKEFCGRELPPGTVQGGSWNNCVVM